MTSMNKPIRCWSRSGSLPKSNRFFSISKPFTSKKSYENLSKTFWDRQTNKEAAANSSLADVLTRDKGVDTVVMGETELI